MDVRLFQGVCGGRTFGIASSMLRTRRILPAFWKSYLWKSGFVMCAPSKCADVSFSLCACCAGSCCASSDFMASNSNRRTLPCHTYLNLPLRSRDLALDLLISCLSLSLSLSLSQILSQILSHPLVLAQNKITHTRKLLQVE